MNPAPDYRGGTRYVAHLGIAAYPTRRRRRFGSSRFPLGAVDKDSQIALRVAYQSDSTNQVPDVVFLCDDVGC